MRRHPAARCNLDPLSAIVTSLSRRRVGPVASLAVGLATKAGRWSKFHEPSRRWSISSERGLLARGDIDLELPHVGMRGTRLMQVRNDGNHNGGCCSYKYVMASA